MEGRPGHGQRGPRSTSVSVACGHSVDAEVVLVAVAKKEVANAKWTAQRVFVAGQTPLPAAPSCASSCERSYFPWAAGQPHACLLAENEAGRRSLGMIVDCWHVYVSALKRVHLDIACLDGEHAQNKTTKNIPEAPLGGTSSAWWLTPVWFG